jgi:luciferase family oxidoreductase group 1
VAIPLSILDLAPTGTGFSSTTAFENSRELALLAERRGFVRYWFAEHHGTASMSVTSPETLIADVAARTRRIRVGAGGILLSNHNPLRVAEAFHTLAALHPGRIDLGIGRAPGATPAVLAAIRPTAPERFPAQLAELMSLSRGDFPEGHELRGVRAMPSDVGLPPVWLLGSSGETAWFAGSLGLGYGFARHISPKPPGPVMSAYRDGFRPSAAFPRPHAIIAVSAICAETDEEAARLASSMELARVRIARGEFPPLPTPEEATAYPYDEAERALVADERQYHFVGAADTVRARIEAVVEETGADEVMVTTNVHNHRDRLRSYELLAEIFGEAGSR